VEIVIPRHLSPEQRELYESLLKMEGQHPVTGKKGFFQDVVDKVKDSVR
jgi:hypothetical protein